ncbi:hypothetical protein MKK70_07205 [Methylobacterium sp. E-041]|jgi:hypothetical protein|uniref:hypothetical protein n=2 Tax=Methylobacterium TaxID=407 RepID=UPI0011CBEA9B|nr:MULTISPECIES: hypothetical protein [unclassified Methylobacterium]MCJ2105172.1 hypothetical protein [Methylobacterium sp. E-041]TXN33047.1 hypothetical protein FV225_19315 [Methylobacterium sp. WL93]TXN47697.1 hypothetical protein FV227_21240 [Methylobacterium sp. WL119]TXN65285.1 hypothetical protein FV230_17115 [Methylobacterium sp. WL6]TXN65384.1 hypothetical protein FV232_18435 [Methylobacterium sp. WL30]
MDAELASSLRRATAAARRHAEKFVGPAGADALPWSVVDAFDAEIRGSVERDRRIEDERDRVLIAAVKLADTRPEDGAEAIEAARDHLVAAIDYLEQAVLRFGVVNRAGAKRGFGSAGQPVTART